MLPKEGEGPKKMTLDDMGGPHKGDIIYEQPLREYYRGIVCDFSAVHWVFFGKHLIVLTSGALIHIRGKIAPWVPTFHMVGEGLPNMINARIYNFFLYVCYHRQV